MRSLHLNESRRRSSVLRQVDLALCVGSVNPSFNALPNRYFCTNQSIKCIYNFILFIHCNCFGLYVKCVVKSVTKYRCNRKYMSENTLFFECVLKSFVLGFDLFLILIKIVRKRIKHFWFYL